VAVVLVVVVAVVVVLVVVVVVGHVTACTTIYKTEHSNPSHTLYFALYRNACLNKKKYDRRHN